MKKETQKFNSYYSPYVDLFLFKIESDTLYEVSPKGKRHLDLVFNTADYFPTRPYYFGGVHFIGPQPQISEKRYAVQNCIMSGYSHRREWGAWGADEVHFCLDCQKLYKVFPFVYDNSFINVHGRADEQQLLSPSAQDDSNSDWFNVP